MKRMCWGSPAQVLRGLRRALGMIVLVVTATGCTDRAKPDFDRCTMLAARDHEGDLPDAVKACTAAVAADPNSTSGKAAAVKLTELQPKLDAWGKKEYERLTGLAKAKEAAAAAQAAAEPKCSDWVTICTLGRFPDGSERTGGLQHYNKGACVGAGVALGVHCDPCRCSD